MTRLSIFIFSFLFLSFSAGSVSAQTLSTGNSLSSGSKTVVKAKPIAGSSILSSTFEVKPGTGAAFLVEKLLLLEQMVGKDFDSLKGKELAAKNEEIRKLVGQVLDLDRLAKRALIAYWDKLGEMKNADEKKKEYLSLFKRLVEENYLEKAKGYVGGKYKIPLVSETKKAPYELVEGKIEQSDVDLLIQFKILKENEKYKVVDVKLDETSLESTYRGSFNRIIRKQDGMTKGFDELIRVMKKRLEELVKGNATRL